MKSYWDVLYVGAHSNIFIKKLQRHLSVQAEDIVKERIIYEGKKCERAMFYLSHGDKDWTVLINDLLTIASRIAHTWRIHLNLPEGLSGNLRSDFGDCHIELNAPEGLESIHWEIRRDQNYQKTQLASETHAW